MQKFVLVVYETKQKESTGNWADSHTTPLECASCTAVGPQGRDAELASGRDGQITEPVSENRPYLLGLSCRLSQFIYGKH